MTTRVTDLVRSEAERLAEQLQRRAGELSATPLEQYVRRNDLGEELSFARESGEIADALVNARRIAALTSPDLPLDVLRFGEGALSQLDAALGKLKAFSVVGQSSNSPIKDVRDRVAGDFRGAMREFYKEATPFFASASAAVLNADASLRHAEVTRLIEQLTDIAERAAANGDRVATVLAVTEAAAGKVGVSKHATHFAEQAEEHLASARSWLIAAASAVAVTVLLAALNLWWSLAQASAPSSPLRLASPGQVAQLITAKVITLSLLLSLTVFCARAYRANRHNYVVNRHRRNALASFQTFVESTEDASTRNAVLIQATQSIFAPQNSGYADGDVDMQSPIKLVELIRPIAEPKA